MLPVFVAFKNHITTLYSLLSLGPLLDTIHGEFSSVLNTLYFYFRGEFCVHGCGVVHVSVCEGQREIKPEVYIIF